MSGRRTVATLAGLCRGAPDLRFALGRRRPAWMARRAAAAMRRAPAGLRTPPSAQSSEPSPHGVAQRPPPIASPNCARVDSIRHSVHVRPRSAWRAQRRRRQRPTGSPSRSTSTPRWPTMRPRERTNVRPTGSRRRASRAVHRRTGARRGVLGGPPAMLDASPRRIRSSPKPSRKARHRAERE
jgi:hypothetical protein